MRELLYRQRKGLSTAKNRITGQEHDWLGEAYVTVRLEVPGLQGCKVIFARSNLRLPAEGNAPAVAKAIDYLNRNVVLCVGVVSDIDKGTFQDLEVMRNLVESRSQSPLFDAFQFKDA